MGEPGPLCHLSIFLMFVAEGNGYMSCRFYKRSFLIFWGTIIQIVPKLSQDT